VNRSQSNHKGVLRRESRTHIAVVDDEGIVRRAVERLLRASGFRVTTFSSAEAFLAGLDGERPDCLVVDVHLGGMSGIDLQHALSSRRETIPVVTITAHDDPATRDGCLQAGTIAYLTKPFDERELIGAIQHALSSIRWKNHKHG
jgi:FixJ family two-component response regulator